MFGFKGFLAALKTFKLIDKALLLVDEGYKKYY